MLKHDARDNFAPNPHSLLGVVERNAWSQSGPLDDVVGSRACPLQSLGFLEKRLKGGLKAYISHKCNCKTVFDVRTRVLVS